LLQTRVCVCVRFGFSVLSQEMGWEECIQNDVFCQMGHKTLTLSVNLKQLNVWIILIYIFKEY